MLDLFVRLCLYIDYSAFTQYMADVERLFKCLNEKNKEYATPIADYLIQLFSKCESDEAVKYNELDLTESTLDLQVGAGLPVPFSVKLLKLLYEILEEQHSCLRPDKVAVQLIHGFSQYTNIVCCRFVLKIIQFCYDLGSVQERSVIASEISHAFKSICYNSKASSYISQEVLSLILLFSCSLNENES